MAKLPVESIYLPAGGIAVFGRTGAGKSGLLYWSDYVRHLIIADTGSLSHRLYYKHGEPTIVDSSREESPIEQVKAAVAKARSERKIWALDSWSTLQEQQVAWHKGKANGRGPAVSLQTHLAIVGQFRDLALLLAQSQGITMFNTAPGGKGKSPAGEEIVYPAGCLTGYPSLNGTGPNSETILARWPTVWGVFAGYTSADKVVPRGLYVPGADIRPDSHSTYSPLKDPLMVVRDTSGGKGTMAVPDMREPANQGRCFMDELLQEIAGKWPRESEEQKAARFIEQARARAEASATITAEQAASLKSKLERAAGNIPAFLAHFKISSLEQLPAREYAVCDKQITDKLAAMESSKPVTV